MSPTREAKLLTTVILQLAHAYCLITYVLTRIHACVSHTDHYFNNLKSILHNVLIRKLLVKQVVWKIGLFAPVNPWPVKASLNPNATGGCEVVKYWGRT